MRKYAVNERYFDYIDSESKAYWLGFIIADGNIKDNSLRLHITNSDVEHLNKFKMDIESVHPISLDKRCNVNYISVNSKAIVSTLSKYGIGHNKTFNATIPEIDPSLKRHLYRGLVDGDGSIYTYFLKSRNVYTWYFSLCGTKSVIQSFKEWINKITNKDIGSTRFQRNIWSITVGGIKGTKDICDILYSNSYVYLDRKYNKYKELLSFIDNNEIRGFVKCKYKNIQKL
jgi:hypothetical protein